MYCLPCIAMHNAAIQLQRNTRRTQVLDADVSDMQYLERTSASGQGEVDRRTIFAEKKCALSRGFGLMASLTGLHFAFVYSLSHFRNKSRLVSVDRGQLQTRATALARACLAFRPLWRAIRAGDGWRRAQTCLVCSGDLCVELNC